MVFDINDTSYKTTLAIIGMAGRFPDAQNVDEFWQNLVAGTSSIRPFSDEELLAAGVDPEQLKLPNYVKAGVILGDIGLFDASFFGFSPREAEVMDPQHRLFLECAYEALENAAYDPGSYKGLLGVYACKGGSNYLIENLVPNRASINTLQAATGNENDAISSTVSYKLNLKGPSVTVQTFCSSSLVAVHQACQSLLNYECDMALAGGVALQIPHGTGYLYEEGGILSPDGVCRAFDASARGSVMGSGAGVIVLKRLAEAVEDGDQIYALVRGSAVNNDGSMRVSYVAPGLDGQTEVIAEALGNAGIAAESISYIETHGTGTVLGDSVELTAMKKAFAMSTEKQQFCAIGSVKPNVGHLDRASGVTGLIKAVHALRHKQLPPSLHFTHAHPDMALEQSPFYVNSSLQEWSGDDGPRRAGVSSFGQGGTNAHVILEESPKREEGSPSRSWQLLLLSARTETALKTATANLHTYLDEHKEANLADVAYSLQIGRSTFNYRLALVCRDIPEALQALDAQQAPVWQETTRGRNVAFLLPGLEIPHIGVTQELYQAETIFREAVDICSVLCQDFLHLDLRTAMYPDLFPTQPSTRRARPSAASVSKLFSSPALAQTALFTIEYALAQMLMQWGIRPQALSGHSLGEYVAACLAGVFSLQDALKLVAGWGQLAETLPKGAMTMVPLSRETAEPYLDEQISLAAINRTNSCVLAGPIEAVDMLEEQLRAQALPCKRLEVVHAWHSSMLEPLREPFAALVQRVELHTPTIPFLSSVTGTWITDEQAIDPLYWVQQVYQPVQFSEGITHLLSETDYLLLEVGIGQFLRTQVIEHQACSLERAQYVLATLPKPEPLLSEQAQLLNTLGALWTMGVCIDWQGFYADERRLRLSLPTYPFERQRYWIEPRKVTYAGDLNESLVEDNIEKLPDMADWFFVPSWKQSPTHLPVPSTSRIDASSANCWLLFIDSDGIGTLLAEQLQKCRYDVITVVAGNEFRQLDAQCYAVQPTDRADYARLFGILSEQGKVPSHMVHLWNVSSQPVSLANPVQILSPVLALIQAFSERESQDCALTLVANDMWHITGDEHVVTEKALLMGPCRVIPQEYDNMSLRCIDMLLARKGSERERILIQHLVGELTAYAPETVVSLRNGLRWVQTYEPLPLHQAQEPYRVEGVYLITGGLGGIGLAIAEYLARTKRARLVLTARSGLPRREHWSTIVQTQGDKKGLGRRISKVLALEALGAKVLVLEADVADKEQMQNVIKQTLASFGTLHGVIHAAGIPASGLMQQKTEEIAARVLAPKVQGTQILEEVLRAIPLDFLVLFSSTSAITGGGPGQVDYCAANAYLDAYAQSHCTRHGITVSVNWGEWQWDAWEDGLQGYPEEARKYFKEKRRKVGISFTEGVEALKRTLARRIPQVVVSTTNFSQTIESSKHFSAMAVMEKVKTLRKKGGKHARRELSTPYVAPDTAEEHQIVAAWEDLLGLDGIGIHDNFFELGGNSLMGAQLISRLRRIFGVVLPLSLVYERLTIAEQSTTVQDILREQRREQVVRY